MQPLKTNVMNMTLSAISFQDQDFSREDYMDICSGIWEEVSEANKDDLKASIIEEINVEVERSIFESFSKVKKNVTSINEIMKSVEDLISKDKK